MLRNPSKLLGASSFQVAVGAMRGEISRQLLIAEAPIHRMIGNQIALLGDSSLQGAMCGEIGSQFRLGSLDIFSQSEILCTRASENHPGTPGRSISQRSSDIPKKYNASHKAILAEGCRGELG